MIFYVIYYGVIYCVIEQKNQCLKKKVIIKIKKKRLNNWKLKRNNK